MTSCTIFPKNCGNQLAETTPQPKKLSSGRTTCWTVGSSLAPITPLIKYDAAISKFPQDPGSVESLISELDPSRFSQRLVGAFAHLDSWLPRQQWRGFLKSYHTLDRYICNSDLSYGPQRQHAHSCSLNVANQQIASQEIHTERATALVIQFKSFQAFYGNRKKVFKTNKIFIRLALHSTVSSHGKSSLVPDSLSDDF